MPPSVSTEADDEVKNGQGFPAFNASRQRRPPPKLKKPVPRYRHLARWDKNKIPESIEEQQMNQDLAILRQALDLFMNSRMEECEAILDQGPTPVTEQRVNGSDLPSTAAHQAMEALSEKLQDTKLKASDAAAKDNDSRSTAAFSSASSTMHGKQSSSGSSTDGKKDGKGKKPRSMYYDLAKGIIQGLRALVVYDPAEIEKGMKAFEQAIKTADKQRKGSIIGLASVKAVGSFVVGTIGAGSFKGMNRVQKHAELIYAEATILRSLLSFVYHVDFWMVIEECINLRNAFTIIQGLKSFMDNVESELKSGKNIDRHQIDEHLISGVTLSYSLYNIIISFMPDIVMKMLQLVGFPSDRDWGMAMLGACGDWDPMAPPETPAEHAERLASSANEGIRRQFCDMVPIIFQVVISSFFPMNHVDLNYAKTINDYNLDLYPDSPFFVFLKGRHLQVTSNLDEAVETYKTGKVQSSWHHLGHIFVFEELMCAMMREDLDTACEKSRELLKGSRWSKCCFRYLTAITGYERGNTSEKRKIDTLMGKVEENMNKFAGMNLFFETFCARKSKRFVKEGRLLLPCYDFMLLWNTFDMMPPNVLQKALATISSEVRRLEGMLPKKMKDRESQPLALNDQTIEAASGGYLSSFFSNKNAILKDSKVEGYENFYDDYCLAFFLQGLVAYHIAFFPEAAFNGEMCQLAHESFQTVFRYAPLINDDTYTYYFSHYYKAKIWIHQGRFDDAKARFKYLSGLTNTTLVGLPALVAGKGKNSLEFFVLMKVHSGMLDIETAKAAAASGGSSFDGSSIHTGSVRSEK